MKLCILSDFDGTITKKDGLYSFISTYAKGDWESIEKMWENGEISSKDCLLKEFGLIPDISEELISSFAKTMEIDNSFNSFYDKISARNIDFTIVSDGIDYFIKKILKSNGLDGIKIISNHGEFRGEKFEISFPNDSTACIHNSGTCKCKVLNDLKSNYDYIVYIGDGISDFCAADKADILFAKSKLAEYCKHKNLEFYEFTTFDDIFNTIEKML